MKQSPIDSLLIFSTIFINSITFFTYPFEGYFHYLIFILYFPFFISKYGFPKLPLQILALPLIVGVFNLILGNNTTDLFLKIFLGMLLSTSFFYYIFLFYEMDVEMIFKLYLKGCVFTCWVGFIQLITFKIGFAPGYDYNWLLNKWALVGSDTGSLRVNSFVTEPAQLSILIIPAVFIAINSLFSKKDKFLTKVESVLILFILVNTSSSTGYIGIFVIGLLYILNYGKAINLVVGIVVLLVIGNVMYSTVPEFRSRVDSSLGLWVDEDLSVKNVNTSSFVLYNNFHISSEVFKSSFLTGNGLGSHKVSFDKYTLTRNKFILNVQFNKSDANSLFLRLISETGLIGIVFIFGLLFRCFIRRNPENPDDYAWLISNSVLVMLILCLVRQGNYFLSGLPFFFWLYYYNYVKYKERIVADPLTPELLEPA